MEMITEVDDLRSFLRISLDNRQTQSVVMLKLFTAKETNQEILEEVEESLKGLTDKVDGLETMIKGFGSDIKQMEQRVDQKIERLEDKIDFIIHTLKK